MKPYDKVVFRFEKTHWGRLLLGILPIFFISAGLLIPGNSPATQSNKPPHPPTETPVPTNTLLPTYTPLPTETPSATSIPSETPIPTITLVSPTPTLPTLTPGMVSIPPSSRSVHIDGNCSFNEYADALRVDFVDGNNTTGHVYLKHDNQYLYVCMVGAAGSYAQRFASVYLDRNNQRGSSPDGDDLSLRVEIETGALSSLQGGGGFFAQSSTAGWTAAARTQNPSLFLINGSDQAEFQVSLTLASPCGGSFSLAVYHHWFAAISNDYGWPVSQYWDVPDTWSQANLAGSTSMTCTYLPSVLK